MIYKKDFMYKSACAPRTVQRRCNRLKLCGTSFIPASPSNTRTCFGLFGIAWYATRQRIREISIRKVHGATRGQIIWLLNKPFCLYAAVAYVLAMPVAWWLMQRWLEQFAYRAPLSVGIFVWPLVVVWGVSALIVCLQGWMLSRVKPVEAMKNE